MRPVLALLASVSALAAAEVTFTKQTLTKDFVAEGCYTGVSGECKKHHGCCADQLRECRGACCTQDLARWLCAHRGRW